MAYVGYFGYLPFALALPDYYPINVPYTPQPPNSTWCLIACTKMLLDNVGAPTISLEYVKTKIKDVEQELNHDYYDDDNKGCCLSNPNRVSFERRQQLCTQQGG
ncbi:MAG: C39 family peptidase [Candidatus Bathyarchaeia archaeon]